MLALLLAAMLVAPADPEDDFADQESPAARPADAALAKVEALYQKAKYKEALKALGASCAELRDVVGCERLRGFIHIALGAERDARAAFERMIAADPQASLGEEVSPKLQAVFDESRRVVLAVLDFQLEPPHSVPRGSVLLEARLAEEASIEQLTLHVEAEEEGFTPYDMEQRSGIWSARVSIDGERLSYYAVARLPSGAEISVGSASQPRLLELGGDPTGAGSDEPRARASADPLAPSGAELETQEELGPFGLPKLAFWGGVIGGAAAIAIGVTLAIVLTRDPEPGEIRVKVVFDQ